VGHLNSLPSSESIQVFWAVDHLVSGSFEHWVIWALGNLGIGSFGHWIIWGLDHLRIGSFGDWIIWALDHFGIRSFGKPAQKSSESDIPHSLAVLPAMWKRIKQ